MRFTPRALVLLTLVSAFVIFCIVQDRVAANGAGLYAALQREALAGRAAPVTIDQVMRPAVRRSVRQGLIWGGVVLVGGLGAAVVLASPRRSPSGDRRE